MSDVKYVKGVFPTFSRKCIFKRKGRALYLPDDGKSRCFLAITCLLKWQFFCSIFVFFVCIH